MTEELYKGSMTKEQYNKSENNRRKLRKKLGLKKVELVQLKVNFGLIMVKKKLTLMNALKVLQKEDLRALQMEPIKQG